ncbi:hypothetical protein C8R44DRAFT_725190 [Mycena epipterygia]|nr:hypothetical protein C8R44DRAFT_725190 [Mycena epipterygia]
MSERNFQWVGREIGLRGSWKMDGERSVEPCNTLIPHLPPMRPTLLIMVLKLYGTTFIAGVVAMARAEKQIRSSSSSWIYQLTSTECALLRAINSECIGVMPNWGPQFSTSHLPLAELNNFQQDREESEEARSFSPQCSDLGTHV